MIRAVLSFASSGDNTAIAAGASNERIKVYSIEMTLASSTTVTFKSGASTSLSGAETMTGLIKDMRLPSQPWFVTAPGQAFVINLGGAVQTSGQIQYTVGF